MSITDLLSKVVVKRELDLTELDEAYTDDGKPIKLPYRVNWPRGIKQERHELRQETFDIQQGIKGLEEAFKGEPTEEQEAKLEELKATLQLPRVKAQ